MTSQLPTHAIMIHCPKTGRQSHQFGFNKAGAFQRFKLLRDTFPHLDLYIVKIKHRDYGKRN